MKYTIFPSINSNYNIQDILPLRHNHTEFRLNYLNPHKVLEFPQVFFLKLAKEMRLKFSNTILITTYYNDVIHINNQIDALLKTEWSDVL